MMVDKYNEKYRVPTTRVSWSKYASGVYFITICTYEGKHYFGEIRNDEMIFTPIALFLKENIDKIQSHYPYASIPYYVVMPNHLHLYLVIDISFENLPENYENSPLVSRIVNGLKGCVTRYANQNGIPFRWQSRFHDHIVRDGNEADLIVNYIRSNVIHWLDDCYHR